LVDEGLHRTGDGVPAQPPVARWEQLALVGIVALALAARLFGLNTSLWYDEVFTVVNFVRLPTADLVSSFGSLNNHIFYNLQTQATVALFGESAWALRLPAVLFGVGSIVLQWVMARRFLGPVQALVVAFLLALSYHHVWFSQNARGYTGLLFWTTAATLVFLDGLARPTWRRWTLYAVLVAAAMYTHLSAGFFFAAHGAVYLALLGWGAFDREAVRTRVEAGGVLTLKPVYGFVLSGVLTLLLHAPVLQQAFRTIGAVSTKSAETGGGLGEWRSPLRTAQEIVASVSSAGALTPVIVAGALLVLVIGCAALARKRPLLTAVYLLHIPLATVILFSLSFRIWPRYFFVDIGFVYIALVHGVFVFAAFLAARLRPQWVGRARVGLTAAAVVVMTVASVGLLARNYAFPKQDFIGARAYVERQARPGDVVAASGLAGYVYSRYYQPRWTVVETGAELSALKARAPRTWVMIAFPYQTTQGKPDVAAVLQRDFERVAVFPGTLGDGDIWVYRSRPGRI
jgi:hypothetical protein